MKLVATGLSMAGYVTVATTIGLENVLDRVEGFVTRFDRERGRDPGLYYLRVFGEPGGDGPWGWRFGGHHVSLNNLVVDGELVATTPCFMGADPASAPLLGGAVNRPLARVEDLARELVRSLTPDLAARAVLLDKAPSDVVTANRTRRLRGRPGHPAGRHLARRAVRGRQPSKSSCRRSAMRSTRRPGSPVMTTEPSSTPLPPRASRAATSTASQRELLLSLLGTYFGRVPDSVSPLASYDDSALDDVHFAWAGPTEPGQPHYYRLQGPRLLIEWDNTQRGANHAHSVWRDPEADFGLDVLAQHRAMHHRSGPGRHAPLLCPLTHGG